ncbi:uncharacterized protein LOC114540227 [Dendronephthya gigantea]|uniref:uncharacterized protein LOC114540227 n=1 Tax=Dendronephthya gigantea TaxID=151771 RepID=UPI00106ADDB3|nr:uncharacterized protein LOC114540227 [Dendronephthya gigantea]
MVDKTKALTDQVLYGYAFRNLAMKTVDECFLACYEDCFCMSFQMCRQNTECQLLSSNQFQSPFALHSMMGCSYYDMVPDFEQFRPDKPAGGCNAGWECRPSINLCQNGGTYHSIAPTNRISPRFKCNCTAGYAGNLCQTVAKSCRGYENSERIPGKYKVFDEGMNLFEVFCDFDSGSRMTWTLILSYQFKHRVTFDKPYSNDLPKNQDSPRWDEYRLSKSRMQSIQKDSSHFRFTCKYDTDGMIYRDYLQASNDQLDILSYKNEKWCHMVDVINVRGQSCSKCTVFFHQEFFILHSDSHAAVSEGCQFQLAGGKTCGSYSEDAFGHYFCVNTEHRCSSSDSATTQTWFG